MANGSGSTPGLDKLAGGVMGVAGATSLAGALAANRRRKKNANDPRFDLEEAGKARAGMLRAQLKEAQSPIDEAMITQQAGDAYGAAMGAAQQANVEKLRTGLAGSVQPGQQLQMFGQATEKAQEEAAKASREAYRQAGEQKLKQADQAYSRLEAEETRLKKERTDKLFDKIPRVVGAAGVALNKLAESGFLDDIIGVGGAIAGGTAGIMGGAAGIAAGAAGGFQAGKELGESVQDAIVENDLGLLGRDDEEGEEPAAEEPAAEAEAPAEAQAPEEAPAEAEPEPEQAQEPAEAQESPEGGMSERFRTLRDSLAAGNRLEQSLATGTETEEPTPEPAPEAEAAPQQEDQASNAAFAIEDEAQHLRTLANRDNMPGLPASSLIDATDFNDVAGEIFGNREPASVNAAYIALGYRPPNDAEPTALQIAQARRSLNTVNSGLYKLSQVLAPMTRRRDALRDNLQQ